jgi:hypothetical protein
MTDPYSYFTPASSLDDTNSRSYDSSGYGQMNRRRPESYSLQSTDFYSPTKGSSLRQRVNNPNAFAYNTDLNMPEDNKKELFSRKVVQRIDFFPKVDR